MNDEQRHKDITKVEFSRQAGQIESAPSFTDEDTFERIVRAVGATYQDTVLDVACGTGIVVFQLAKTAKRVVGLDLTGEMLQRARKQRHDQGIGNVRFVLGEAESLPFPDDRFDATVCRMSVHHFAQPAHVLAEMVRVTRPGGRLVIADIVTSDQPQDAQLHNAIERLRDPSHVRMLDRDALLAQATDQGLLIQRTEDWSKVRRFSEWAEVLNAPHRIEPLAVVLRALAEAGRTAGIGLHLEANGELAFEHQWLMVVAEKSKRNT